MGQYRERQHSSTLESGKWRSGGGSASASLLGRKKVSTVFLDVVVYSVGGGLLSPSTTFIPH